LADSFFAWLQATPTAKAIADSVLVTASLSSIHLLGFTLLMGSALVLNLRLAGVLFQQRPIGEVLAPADRGIVLGLIVSIVTGALLFAARASTVSESGFFQLKMTLLVTAVVFHFALERTVTRRTHGTSSRVRLTGLVGLALWVGLALAACAFILLE
jgi:hypothetical protein